MNNMAFASFRHRHALPEDAARYSLRGVGWPWKVNQDHFLVFFSVFVYKFKLKENCPCVLTEHHAMKAYCGSRDIAPRILDLDTRLRWVVSFTPRPLYP